MIGHRINIELYDESAELLALHFTTGRLIIRWGSGITSCVSALRFDGAEWRRETVPHGYRVTALAGPAGDSRCRDLGAFDGDVFIEPTVADELGAWVSRLRGRLPRSSLEHLRGCARWLMALESRLMHGFDLIELLACEPAVPVGGGSEVDDLLGALVRLEFIEPHAFMPTTDAIFMPGDAKQAQGFARRLGNWTGHRDSSSSPGGEPERDASPVGAKHWLFQQGAKWPL